MAVILDGGLNSCGENYHCSQCTLISAVVWTAPGSWRPAQDRKGEWVGVTFYQTMSFDSMTIAGEPNSFSFVTSFRIQYQFTMHAPWYWIESPDGTPMVSSKVYKNDSFSHKLHYPFKSHPCREGVFKVSSCEAIFCGKNLHISLTSEAVKKLSEISQTLFKARSLKFCLIRSSVRVYTFMLVLMTLTHFQVTEGKKRQSLVFRMSQK